MAKAALPLINQEFILDLVFFSIGLFKIRILIENIMLKIKDVDSYHLLV